MPWEWLPLLLGDAVKVHWTALLPWQQLRARDAACRSGALRSMAIAIGCPALAIEKPVMMASISSKRDNWVSAAERRWFPRVLLCRNQAR